ncbi:TlpA disulfide reductase family protein [Tenacibaculum sp. IB213877]|uniref:TlpA family protein disulfide reductase n=1 Tax=Tenacibaculum sp. IB213877 TaxID=3097351 RepID=UPI002A5A7EF6|nr:TlpA disulfide reductase family protein [Tenacibaculum sp. IB213877]MDY0780165.1 TlpA disulfide reductase family protein [Tenacibaculum sp. IB213877]
MNLKKHLTWSNLIFVLVVALMLYKPTRVWFIRQVSFSPSVSSVEKSQKITDYNWPLYGLNTESVNFSQFENKVVFLNFWATWCPPCIAEFPFIQELYKDYKDNVAFVFVTNENWEEVEAFFQKNNYDFPTYQSSARYPKGLPSVSSIPTTFIIDKKGNIRVQKTGSADWNSESFRKSIDGMLSE